MLAAQLRSACWQHSTDLHAGNTAPICMLATQHRSICIWQHRTDLHSGSTEQICMLASQNGSACWHHSKMSHSDSSRLHGVIEFGEVAHEVIWTVCIDSCTRSVSGDTSGVLLYVVVVVRRGQSPTAICVYVMPDPLIYCSCW